MATVALFTQLGHFSSDADEGQVQDRVQRPPEAGAGEGVPLQPLHHHQEEGRTRSSAELVRETGERVRGEERDYFNLHCRSKFGSKTAERKRGSK